MQDVHVFRSAACESWVTPSLLLVGGGRGEGGGQTKDQVLALWRTFRNIVRPSVTVVALQRVKAAIQPQEKKKKTLLMLS